MNSTLVFQIVLSVFLWVATILFFLGRGRVLGVGYNLLPIKEKESEQNQEEIKVQCRYIARMLLLPLSVLFTALTAGQLTEAAWWQWVRSNPWLGFLLFIALFAYVFFVMYMVNSGKYKNTRE